MRTLLVLITFLASQQLLLGQCEISNLIAEASPCENGEFYVDIDFDVVNPESMLFGLLGNSTNYGTFSYDSLPITVGPLSGDGVTEWEFIVFDTEEPECQAIFELGIIDCCQFTEISVTEIECSSLTTYDFTLDLVPENTGDVGFDLYDSEENFIGFYTYESLPVQVLNFPSNDNDPTTMIICDNDDPDCCTEFSFEGPDCDTTDCEIFEVSVTAGECENGVFFVTLDFTFENQSGTFTVQGNGNSYGTFSYDSLPVQIGPLEGDGMTVYEFVVRDSDDESCTNFAVLEPVTCPVGCGFAEIVVDPIECVDETSYDLALNFIPTNNGTLGFTVSTGGTVLGSFSYDDLPVIINAFPSSGNFFDFLTLTDNEDSTCTQVVEFQALMCGSCLIYDVIAEPSACNDDGQFTVTIDFQYFNTSDSFQLGGNGNVYGTFAYSELPVTLGPFPGDGSTFYEFAAVDNENAFCFDGVELGFLNCACEISELTVEFIECTSEETYNISVNFTATNNSGSGYDVFANGEFFGFYPGDALPGVIENFPVSGNDFDLLEICDNDNLVCCSFIEFEAPNCSEECLIFNVVVEPIECTSDSTFSAFINFEYTGTNVGGFDYYSGDNYLGFISADSIPTTLLNIPSIPDGNNSLTICASDDSLCCTTVVFPGINCLPAECNIFDLTVETGECTSDSTFVLFFDFEYEGITGGGFDFFAGDQSLGFFPLESIPSVFEAFPLPDGLVGSFTICDNDNPECCATIEFDVPECTSDCAINELSLDYGDCTSDTTFALAVNFNAIGFDSSAVEIWVDSIYLGAFPLVLPISLDIPVLDAEVALLTICAIDNDDCCIQETIEIIPCNNDVCSIFGLEVDPVECLSDSTMSVLIEFDFQNTGGVGFDFFAGDNLIAFFPINNIPEIISFPIPGEGNAVLTICDNDNPECCATIEFEPLNCTGADSCSITELVAEAGMCNDTGYYFVTLDFEASGTGSEGFSINGNGNNYGNFGWDAVPVTLGPFPGDGETQLEFVVFDLTNGDCNAAIGLDTINCMSVGTQELDDTRVSAFFSEQNLHISTDDQLQNMRLVSLRGEEIARWTEIFPGETIKNTNGRLVPGIYLLSWQKNGRPGILKIASLR